MHCDSLATTLFKIMIVSLQPLQFGLHMAILNAPMAYMRCDISEDCIKNWSSTIPGSIYAFGGLLGSFFVAHTIRKFGVHKTLTLSSVLFAVGSAILAFAHTQSTVIIARIITGVAAGIAIVASPIFISLNAPPSQKALFGTATQLNVNGGIIIAQLLGTVVPPRNWRWIMYASLVVALISMLLLVPVQDSHRLETEDHSNSISVSKLLRDPGHSIWRNIAVSLFAVQQLTGINAIIVYGVRVLGKVFPDQAKIVNLLVSVVNFVATLASATIIAKRGTRDVLIMSLKSMGVFTALLAFAMHGQYQMLTVCALFLATISFALGIGPIPFSYIGEVTPREALNATQSLGTMTSWISTFFVLAAFPYCEKVLGADAFYIFSVSTLVSSVAFSKYLPYHGYTETNEHTRINSLTA